MSSQACPCGSNKKFELCCGPFLSGAAQAATAEALMRSRYSAYTLNDEAYLRATWDERTCPKERITHDEPTRWLGLEVKKFKPDGDAATVEFVARYKIGGKAHRLHEISRFVRYEGKWFYVDGSFPEK
ncbi:YchJ family protein [Undibacterium sp. TJN19]|uniref:YchJ family protein n=1 Tax=Undibacterium sp. TJN19 TaxID=3413055 RepID=UPI003BF1E76A